MYRAKGAGGRRLELFDEDLRREVSAQMEMADDYGTRCRATSCDWPTSRSCRSPADRPWASRRSCAAPSGRQQDLQRPASGDLPAAGREQRADRADRQLGAARRLRPGRDMASRRHRHSRVREHLRARAHGDGSGGARARGARYCRLPGRALCLEVSEDAVQRDPERARAALKDVKRLGVSVALDNLAPVTTRWACPATCRWTW